MTRKAVTGKKVSETKNAVLTLLTSTVNLASCRVEVNQ